MVTLGEQSKSVDNWYINANYISSLWNKNQPKQFIATQGPIPKSSENFWRMVWNEKAEVVVMLCGLEEHGRVACHVYYPEGQDMAIGKTFSLKLVET